MTDDRARRNLQLMNMRYLVSQSTRGFGFEIGIKSLAMVLGLSGCADVPSRPAIAEMQLVSSGQPIAVRSLHCPPAGPLFASGVVRTLSKVEGVILYSDDRGAAWNLATMEPAARGVPLSLVDLPIGIGRQAVYAFGYRTGEGVFDQMANAYSLEPGPWWSTQDQGRTWQQTAPRFEVSRGRGFGQESPRISIVDEAGTLVVASSEAQEVGVLRSSDSGQTWARQGLPGLNSVSSLISDGRGHVVLTGTPPVAFWGGERSVIYWSADSGRSWQEAGGTRIQAVGGGGLGLYRSPQGAMLAFNTGPTNSDFTDIYHSSDNGRTWAESKGQDHSGRILGIAGDLRGRLVAVTEYDRLLLSDDGGANWWIRGKVSSKTTGSFNIGMASSGDGIFVAMMGRGTIMRSTDRGETWVAVESGLTDRLFGPIAHCEDGNGLIVMMSSGIVTRSTDWGATWRPGQLSAPAAQH